MNDEVHEPTVVKFSLQRDLGTKTQLDAFTTATDPYIQDGPTQSRPMYALFCLVTSYSIMFFKRLFKDLFQSLLPFFYCDRMLPDHISDLIRVHKRLRLERASEDSSETSLDYYFSWNSLHSDTSLGYFTMVRRPRYFSISGVLGPEVETAVKFLESESNLILACELGDNDLIEKLISEGVDVNLRDPIGRTAIHFAVHDGNIRGIKMLLEAGAYTNIRDYVGLTPLQICVMRRPSVEVAKLLFSYGAVIMPRVKSLSTGIFLQFTMMCVPTPEETELLALLLENGALINDPNVPGGRSALHFAAMSNNCKLIHVLIDLGADIFAKNHRGETPYDAAVIFKCKEAIKCLRGFMNLSPS